MKDSSYLRDIQPPITDSHKNHKPFDTVAAVRIMELEKENELLKDALKESFELLEEHQPQWYLRGHYNRFKKALDEAE